MHMLTDEINEPECNVCTNMQASGAQKLLDSLLNNADFLSNPSTRAAGLERVRTLIIQHPVDAVLLSEMEEAIKSRFVTSRIILSRHAHRQQLRHAAATTAIVAATNHQHYS
jgi:hypothetical protein